MGDNQYVTKDDLQQALSGFMQELKGHLDTRFAEMRQESNSRFEKIDLRFEQIEQRFGQIEQRLARLEARFAAFQEETSRRFAKIDERFEQVEKRLTKLEQRFQLVEQRLTKLAQRTDKRFAAMQAKIEAKFIHWEVRLDRRLLKLDEKIDKLHKEMSHKLVLADRREEKRIAALRKDVRNRWFKDYVDTGKRVADLEKKVIDSVSARYDSADRLVKAHETFEQERKSLDHAVTRLEQSMRDSRGETRAPAHQ